MSVAHRTAALRTRDCRPSAASCVVPFVVVADVARTAAAVSASLDSPGWDVEVAGGDEGRRWVVVGDRRRIPCRIEEGGEEGAAATRGERREGRRKCEWSGGMEGTGAAVARRRQRRVPAERMMLACCPCLRMTCQPIVLRPNLRAPPASAGTASRFAALSCGRSLFGRRARRRRSGAGNQTDETRTAGTSRGSKARCNGGRVRREAVPVRADKLSVRVSSGT